MRGSPFYHAHNLIDNTCFPVSSLSFSLSQRPPSPPSWRNEKLRLRNWKLESNPMVIGEEPTERKIALETTGSTIRRLRGIKIWCGPLRIVRDQCLSTHANFYTGMLHTRWTLLEIRKDTFQRDLPARDEACARHRCFHYDPHKHL
jgi:hypothetical protein